PFQFHIQFSKITVSNRPGQTLEEGPAASVNGLIRPPTEPVNHKIIKKRKNFFAPPALALDGQIRSTLLTV
ncbi:hypothetical protein, partial [Gluconobacter frateurii]